MSREEIMAVRMPRNRDIDELLQDIEAGFRRAEKCEPGERADVAALETLSASLQLRAAEAVCAGDGTSVDLPDPSLISAGLFRRTGEDVVVVMVLPLEKGAQVRTGTGRAAPEPASVVDVRDDIWGRRLVEERLRVQLDAAIAEPGKDRASALSPSGVHNRVLTEVLRQYVASDGEAPVSVPVVYRDGSKATSDFPFKCLDLASHVVADVDEIANGTLVLRVALLSIRHTEMDAVVDGAWLRNADVSKPRPAAQTDDYVFHASLQQLKDLTRDGQRKARLYVYQTGLETAVVGFFRAVVMFLIEHPGQLEVIPMFFSRAARPSSVEGSTGTGHGLAGYEKGEPWATIGETSR